MREEIIFQSKNSLAEKKWFQFCSQTNWKWRTSSFYEWKLFLWCSVPRSTKYLKTSTRRFSYLMNFWVLQTKNKLIIHSNWCRSSVPFTIDKPFGTSLYIIRDKVCISKCYKSRKQSRRNHLWKFRLKCVGKKRGSCRRYLWWIL